MFRTTITLFASLGLCSAQLLAATDPYTPLSLYEGNWTLTKSTSAREIKPDQLANHCARLGQYFLCEQTINGEQGDLIVLIPRGQSGHYYTQAVTKEGRATGRGDLLIEGERWTYLDRVEENGKTAYYRNVNLFSGKDRIHFEQSESSDGVHWTVKDAGDEVRSAQ